MLAKLKLLVVSLIRKKPRFALPIVYLIVVCVGFVIALANLFSDALTICPTVFGVSVCAPLGVYIGLLASIPGYLIATNLLPFLGNLDWFISLVLVVLTSIIFYSFVGWLIETFRSERKVDEKIKILILILFSLLVLIAVLFYLSL